MFGADGAKLAQEPEAKGWPIVCMLVAHLTLFLNRIGTRRTSVMEAQAWIHLALGVNGRQEYMLLRCESEP